MTRLSKTMRKYFLTTKVVIKIVPLVIGLSCLPPKFKFELVSE